LSGFCFITIHDDQVYLILVAQLMPDHIRDHISKIGVSTHQQIVISQADGRWVELKGFDFAHLNLVGQNIHNAKQRNQPTIIGKVF